MNKQTLYIGLMSGTSIDAVDAVIVDFTHETSKLVKTHSHEIPHDLQQLLFRLSAPSKNELHLMGEASTRVGELFAQAANELLKKATIDANEIIAIGSHGQTLRHEPSHHAPFTIQIGDPNIIAARTNITTVADFRRKDIANGGQGAPLTPAFHAYLAREHQENCVFLNIGGIANATIIKEGKVIGFDTGPGNTLLDAWICEHHNKKHDDKGEWAVTGKVNQELLETLLSDPYFELPSPKSTSSRLFNLAWVEKQLDTPISPQDVQTTLTMLTATAIADAIKKEIDPCKIFVCGGGIYNDFLMMTLKELLADYQIESTDPFGIAADWMEACAFAWFAKQTLVKAPIDLRTITGAIKPAILGGVYYS